MNSTTVFVIVLLSLISATIVFTFPNPVHAKISFCASGDTLYRDNVFQCFMKDNDCKTFSENNRGTECIKNKS